MKIPKKNMQQMYAAKQERINSFLFLFLQNNKKIIFLLTIFLISVKKIVLSLNDELNSFKI